MKKICHLTTVHNPFDTRIFYKEARTLKKAGYDVCLIAQHNKNEIIDGIKIIALPKPKNRFHRMLFLTKKAYELALAEKADIYHFHDPELLPWAVKLRKKTGAKIIYDIHEDYYFLILVKNWVPKIFRKLFAKIFNFYQIKKIKKIDYLIVVLDFLKEKFKKYNQNIQTIGNLPLLEYFKKYKAQPFSSDVIKLIYISSKIEETKGADKIIELLKYLPSWVKLIMVGKIVSPRIKTKIEKIPQRIEYLGEVSFPKIPLILAQADIGICFNFSLFPLLADVSSNKFFEYLAAGLPVVACYFPSFKNFIEKEKCGIFIDENNPLKVAEAIKYLISHPQLAQKMGQNARKAIFERYSWENEAKKLLEVYKILEK